MNFLIPLIALILVGCTSSRPSTLSLDVIDDFSGMSIESVMDSVRSHVPPDSFRAIGTMAMKSPLYSGPELRSEILHRRSDSLLMIFSVRGLGFEAGRLLVTHDSIFVYDRISKQVSVADSSHPVFLPIMRVNHAIESLLGYVHPTPSDDLQLEITPNQLIFTDTLLHRTYTINTDYWRTMSIVQHDDLGSLVEGLYYNDFFQVGNFYFPRQVIYRNLPTETSVILSYNQIMINEPLKPMLFNLPHDVNRISYSNQ